jgi:hypothetical protein
VAVVDTVTGMTHSYAKLYTDVCAYATELEELAGGSELGEARVGLLAEKGYPVVMGLLAVWVRDLRSSFHRVREPTRLLDLYLGCRRTRCAFALISSASRATVHVE